MTTQSPDQSFTQSPAPSKEMESRIHALATLTERALMAEATPYTVLFNAFKTLAAELGKEGEEIRYQAACSGLWYEKASAAGTLKAIQIGSSIYQIPNIDPLIEEIVRLKRELAEARETEKKNVEDWQKEFKHRDQQSAQLLALSASYQRQKEALVNLRGWAVANTTKPIHDLLAVTDSALAETPDVSLLDRVVSVLSELVELVDSPDYKSDSFTAQPARALLSTLQPHQK